MKINTREQTKSTPDKTIFTAYKNFEQDNKLKQFLLSLGKAGETADKVSDLILFHNRVRENAKKRYM